MNPEQIISLYGNSAATALGFFWKAAWAFVLGYAVSAMIQTFIPKKRLTRYMGKGDAKGIGLATAFGAISSSCSFAALSAARALVLKGAHFVAAVAFMFASTNLVIELGILILIFLGWQFLAAELLGGLILIAVSSLLIKITYPRSWLEAAREKVENEAEDMADDFNPWDRIASREGWHRGVSAFSWNGAWSGKRS